MGCGDGVNGVEPGRLEDPEDGGRGLVGNSGNPARTWFITHSATAVISTLVGGTGTVCTQLPLPSRQHTRAPQVSGSL
jgi:hypothetical protein